MGTVTAVEPDGISISLFLFQGHLFSLVLARRYRAHATASHAQDCPSWSLEDRPGWELGTGDGDKLFFPFQKIKLLWSWAGVIVHVLRHHKHESVLVWGQMYKYIRCMCQLTVKVFLYKSFVSE